MPTSHQVETNSSSRKTGRQPLRENAHHHQIFELYADNGGRCRQTAEISGTKERTLHRWVKAFGWQERLEKIEAAMRQESEERIIRERRKRLEEQLAAGTLLRRRAFEHFLKYPIEKTSDAIAAAKVGVELERSADSMPTIMLQIATASPEQLAKIIEDLETRRAAAIADGSYTPTPPRPSNDAQPAESSV